MNALAALSPPPAGTTAPTIVGFLAIKHTPKLLVSLGSKIPRDIVPMPIDRLASLYVPWREAPIALHGLVVCVPQSRFSAEERASIDDLAQMIPVLRVGEDGREEGLSFFDRCRQAAPRVPRSVTRQVYRQPVVVRRMGHDEEPRLLLLENVSDGGVFVRDPTLACGPGDRLLLRFPGLRKVPELTGCIRWVQPERKGGQPLGYGCVFDAALDLGVRRLLDEAQAPAEPMAVSAPVSPKVLPGKVRRRGGFKL